MKYFDRVLNQIIEANPESENIIKCISETGITYKMNLIDWESNISLGIILPR